MLILFLVLLFATTVNAQLSNFKIGIQYGLGIANSIAKYRYYYNYRFIEQDKIYYQAKFAMLGGFLVNLKIIKKFSFQSEILLEDKGHNVSDGSYFSKVFIHFPEMVRYYIPLKYKSEKEFFVEAGMYFSCLLYTYYHNDQLLRKLNQHSGDIDYGLTTGIGFKFPINIGQFDIVLKYENSFLPIDKITSGHDYLGLYYESHFKDYYRILNLSVSYYLPVKHIKSLFNPKKYPVLNN